MILSTTVLTGCASKVGLGDLPAVDSKYTRTDGVLNKNLDRSVNSSSNVNSVINDQMIPIKTVNADYSKVIQPTESALLQRSIYFDYDSFIISESDKPVLAAHSAYLRNHRNQTLALEGHTDERGGREYNLALGQKRALAVQRAMQLLGVSESQLESVSFGKESPKALGHTEADYAQNRRVDIRYK